MRLIFLAACVITQGCALSVQAGENVITSGMANENSLEACSSPCRADESCEKGRCISRCSPSCEKGAGCVNVNKAWKCVSLKKDEIERTDEKKGTAAHRPNNFTFNILGAALGVVGLSYTRGFGDVFSLNIKGMYAFPYPFFRDNYSIAGGELAFYFWTTYPNDGFYYGPFCQFSKTFSNSPTTIGSISATPGFELGYRWLLSFGLNFGLGFGLGATLPISWDECPAGYTCNIYSAAFFYKLVFDIGFAF